jgi:OOP family OmpA-OmpF porin
MKLALLLTLLCSVSAFAQDQSSGMTKGRLSDEYASGVQPTGFLPLLGAGAGYTNYNRDLDVEGMPTDLKLIGSYVTPGTEGVFDVGYGIMNQQFSQKYGPNSSVTGAVLELAARYQFANRWQFGVVGNTFFNQGSTYGANQQDAQFAGLQLLKEFDISNGWFARVGGRVMTDINVDNKDLGIAMIDLQIGWNPYSKRTTVRDTAAAEPARPVETAPTSGLSYINNGVNMVNFQFDSAAVPVADAGRMQRLAKALKQHEDLFGSIEVVGYADPIGTEAYNEKLSTNRADQVAKVLEKAGLQPKLIKTEGRGETNLIATNEDDPNFAKNRRVEINFKDVKDEGALKDLVSSIH